LLDNRITLDQYETLHGKIGQEESVEISEESSPSELSSESETECVPIVKETPKKITASVTATAVAPVA